MPTILPAPTFTDFTPTEPSIAYQKRARRFLPTFSRLRARRFTWHDTGFVPRPTNVLAPAGETTASPEFRGAGSYTPSRNWRPSARPAGRLLGWLSAGAAVARYSVRFLPAVMRSHSFVIPETMPVLQMTASLPGRRIDAWKSFFQCPEEGTPPLTYFTSENSRLFFRLVGAFGINFRHLLLVQHDLVAGAGARCVVPDAEYELQASVGVLRVRPRQRVTFAGRCVVRRVGHSEPVFETTDRFLVKNVPERDCKALARLEDTSCGDCKEPPAPRLDPTSSGVIRLGLRIPMDAGVGFGLLSGDLNFVHAYAGLARLFGHRRPFAQGLYTSNKVMATLARLAGRAPTRLSVRFCRPLYLGQEATLLHSENAFEVLEASGNLAAAGTFGT